MNKTMERDSAVVSKLKDLLGKYAEKEPGFTFMARYDNSIHYEGAVGLAVLAPARKLVVNDVFNLASVSKQFTAFAILLLEKEGKLSLEESLYKFMPELGEYVKPVTISHLIHHTSGLWDYIELAEKKGIFMTDTLTSAETLKHLCELTKTEFVPGTQHAYSNTGYFLLAQIVEKVSGMTIREFSRLRIFEPLGMHNTFIVDHYPVGRDYVLSYDAANNKDEVIWDHTGDGQVHSNVHDLMLWGQNMATGKVGGVALIRKSTTPFCPQTLQGEKVTDYEPYAFGLIAGKIGDTPILEHSGGWASYSTNFIRIPGSKLTIAVLSNSARMDAVAVSYEIAEILLKEK
nr:serine hydrolase domain-containing protein [uncultured Chitinophaga sp.]